MAENYRVGAKSCFTNFANNSCGYDSYRQISESCSQDIEPVIKLSDNTAMLAYEGVGDYDSNKLLHNPINIRESPSMLKQSEKQDSSYEDPELPSEISERERLLEQQTLLSNPKKCCSSNCKKRILIGSVISFVFVLIYFVVIKPLMSENNK